MKTKSTTKIVRLKAKKLPTLTDSVIDGSRTVGEFTVTSEIAKSILEERNSTPADKIPSYTNRNLRKRSPKTNRLVMDIEEGFFYPSLLKFSTEGVLLDGQHRLHAINLSKKKVNMIGINFMMRACIGSPTCGLSACIRYVLAPMSRGKMK